MKFDIFVLPFYFGLVILIGGLLYKYVKWISLLNQEDKKKIIKGILSTKLSKGLWEIFLESLLHRKIFRVNFLLGYMHASIAFGWFLLIVIGSIRYSLVTNHIFHWPHEAIFMEYFVHEQVPLSNVMDFLLIIVLSGICLALVKRIASKMFGMQTTTQLQLIDKIALISLWLIFPIRLMAESISCGVYKGSGFLTGTLGAFFSNFSPLSDLVYPTYLTYSIVLGVFFALLPFSRYMHIPTEVLLIFLRKFGMETKDKYTTFSDIEVNSCARCGICIDKCQLVSVGIKDTQAVYFLREIRKGINNEDTVFNCLMCGRCKEFCPVGISISRIRMAKRGELIRIFDRPLDYLKVQKGEEICDIFYFAGCMTHLTLSIKKSMIEILNKLKINYLFMDEKEACCGRPLRLSGEYQKAKSLIEYNTNLIKNSQCKTLITSCPICVREFRESYNLENINIMHHSQFLFLLLSENLKKIEKINKKVVYHDPCELGRGCGIYEEPRKMLEICGVSLIPIKNQREDALCCGNTLGNLKIKNSERALITLESLEVLTEKQPEIIVTACPLCKKTFTGAIHNGTQVMDICEIADKAIFN